jgi:hypothetical protein
MITIQILEAHDVIRMDDWCRPLNLISMSGGHSDHYSFTSQYGGAPENNVKWVPVGAIFGDVWEGATVKALNKEFSYYEFARGPIPKGHQLEGVKLLPPIRKFQ